LHLCVYTIVYRRESLVVGISGLSVIIGIQCYPYFIDIIMSKNGSYKRYLVLLLSKYYVMEEKHFDMLIVYYVFILHMNLLWAAGTFVLVSIGTMMLSYFILICGMFRIARYEFLHYIYKIIQIIIILAEILFTVTVLKEQ